MTPHKLHQQMGTHDRDWARSLGHGHALAPVDDSYRRDRSALRGRAGFHGCCTSLLTGAGFNRSAHFSRFMCCAHFPQFERRRRQVGAVLLLPRTRLVATNSCRPLTSAGNSDAFNTIHNIARQSSYGSECHSVRRLSVAGFDTQQRSERLTPNVRKIVGADRNG